MRNVLDIIVDVLEIAVIVVCVVIWLFAIFILRSN